MTTRCAKKKTKQLGVHPATAAHQLRTDLLYFAYVVLLGCVCYRCGQEMARANFSIDHIDNWLDSDDPVERFFDLSNVSFSHLGCNVSAARRERRKTDEELAGLPATERRRILKDRKRRSKEQYDR